MKKILFSLVLIGLTLTSLKLASHHYRYELYDQAIAFEAQRSDFALKELNLNNSIYSYLENKPSNKTGTIVMLHGFSASKENWLRFAVPLSDKFHLIALDLKGHGQSSGTISDNFSIQDQVNYLYDFLQTLNLKEVFLIGNSMGGAIASLYAANFPEQVKGIVLISPAGVHDIESDMDKLLKDGSNPLIANSSEQFLAVKEFVMEDMPFIPEPVTEVLAEKAVSRYDINHKIFSDLRADLTKGLDARFKDIKAPALLIWGEQDRVINVENITKYASLISNSETLRLPHVGHLAMLEVPNKSADAALNFIQHHQ